MLSSDWFVYFKESSVKPVFAKYISWYYIDKIVMKFTLGKFVLSKVPYMNLS